MGTMCTRNQRRARQKVRRNEKLTGRLTAGDGPASDLAALTCAGAAFGACVGKRWYQLCGPHSEIRAFVRPRPRSHLMAPPYPCCAFANIRTGSFASVWPDHGDFRSTPVNVHSQDRRACLKGATSRHRRSVLGSSSTPENSSGPDRKPSCGS